VRHRRRAAQRAEAGGPVHDPDASRFRQRPTAPHGWLRVPDEPQRRGPDPHVRHVVQASTGRRGRTWTRRLMRRAAPRTSLWIECRGTGRGRRPVSDEEAARAEFARLVREHDPAPLPIDVLVELERILTDAGRRRSRPRAHRQSGRHGQHDCSSCPLSESPGWQGLFRDSASPKGEDLQGLQPDASHVGGGWAAGPGRSGVWRCRPVSGGACRPKRRP